MKKMVFLLLTACLSIAAYSESILDYFPTQSGSYWVYESANGSVVDGCKAISSAQQNDGTWCYLFQNATSFGNTTTLYGLIDGKIVKLAFRNILGKASEYHNPYPLVIATPGITYNFNDGDDCRCTTEKASVVVNGKTYTDCILVTERIYVSGKVVQTQKSYYARNIGLVCVVNVDSAGRESIYKQLAETNLC